MDHPLLRNAPLCVLCTEPKEQGLLVCWHCFRRHGMRYANPTVDAILDHCEMALALAPVD